MRLAIESIRRDGGTQPRVAKDWETIYDYADLMTAGVKLPPVTVFYDGSDYWLADGFHRVEAALSADLTEVDADVNQGTLADAQWFSFSANQSHGLRRSNDDKARAVKAALAHPKCALLSDREIAKHVGVSHEFVRSRRSSICQPLTDNKSRTVTRNGTTYEQNVSNIGRKSEQPSPPPATPSAPPQPPKPDPPSPNIYPPQPTPPVVDEPDDELDLDDFTNACIYLTDVQYLAKDIASAICESPNKNYYLIALEKAYGFIREIRDSAAAKANG